MTTISIYYEIKDLFNQDEWKSIQDEFSCPICYELIYKQEWYQCSQGHPSCITCWMNIMADNSSKKCSSCRVPIKSFTDGLSRCRFIEQSFTNKKIRCPYSYKENIKNKSKNNKLVHDLDNGCKDIIKVEQLEDHQKNCNSRFVKCDNKGCNQVSRYIQHLEHVKECKHAIIECELCSSEIKRSSLTNHKESCPSRIITCTQCPLELKKSELQDHIDKECPNTIIQCKFQPYGCKDEFKRSKLTNHLEQVNHTTHMLKLIDNQSQQLDNQSKQINQQSHQLNELKQCNIKYNTELNQCKKELQESNNRCNEILNKFNNQISYSNTWIISKFLQRNGADKDIIRSPLMNVPPYQFTLITKFTTFSQYYYLTVKDSTTSGRTIKIKCTIKLLNHKDSTKNKTHCLEFDYEINSQGGGNLFPIVDYSIESGYVFPDGSVHLEFTIDIPKSTIQS